MSLLKTNVKAFAKYLHDFIDFKGFDEVILLGNSLGGHIGLYHTKMYPETVKALIITGSSGLYESAMGGGYTKRRDYEVIKKESTRSFLRSCVATKDIVDEVYETVNDSNKLIKTLAIAKSAIRHNMAKDLPKMKYQLVLFGERMTMLLLLKLLTNLMNLLPDSELFWIDKCGHAAMMEHPDEFNQILNDAWLEKRGIILLIIVLKF